MSYILAIETSGAACSAALLGLDAVWAEQYCAIPRRHAAIVPLQVQALLEHAGVGPGQLLAIAVSAGPGSYTGLRIGASTAKGLAFGWDLPIVAVPSTAVLAQGAFAQHSGAPVLVLLEALRNDVYTALYAPDGTCLQPSSAQTLTTQWLDEQVGLASQSPIILAGDGAAKVPMLFPDWWHTAASQGHILLPQIHCRAQWMQPLAWAQWQTGNLVEAARFEPNYLKAFHLTVSDKKPF